MFVILVGADIITVCIVLDIIILPLSLPTFGVNPLKLGYSVNTLFWKKLSEPSDLLQPGLVACLVAPSCGLGISFHHCPRCPSLPLTLCPCFLSPVRAC